MNLLQLPVELLTCSLLQLDAKQISICRAVCKQFQQLIDSTPSILYHLELLTSCTLDNSLSTLSISEKFAHLRQHNNAWRTLKPTRTITNIPIHNYASVYELAGGHFFQDVNRNHNEAQTKAVSCIRWMELPGRISGSEDGVFDAESEDVRKGEWALDFKVSDLCLDVERDLIIFVERVDSNTQSGQTFEHLISLTLHLRTLSTNTQHPDANLPYLKTQILAHARSDYSMIVQLSGDHVGLLLSRYPHVRNERNDTFVLWNWMNGTIKGSLHTTTTHHTSFCFTSPTTLLLSETMSAQLHLYKFAESSDSLQHTASLLLPEAHWKPVYISIRTDPGESRGVLSTRKDQTSARGKGKGPQKNPFHTDPCNAIVLLTLDYVLPPPLPLQNYATGGILEQQQQQEPQHQEAPANTPAPMLAVANPNGDFPILFDISKTEVFAVQRGTLRDITEFPEQWTDLRRASANYGENVDGKVGNKVFGTRLNEEQDDFTTHNTAPAALIPSSTWTPHTRWGLPSPPPRWVCYVHGSRYVSVGLPVTVNETTGVSERTMFPVPWWIEAEGEGANGVGNDNENANRFSRRGRRKVALRVCEFNVDGIRREECLSPSTSTSHALPSSSTSTSASHLKITSASYSSPRLFPNPIPCALPYRIIQTADVFEWDSVLVDGERVLGVREEGEEGVGVGVGDEDNDGLAEMDVLVF